MAHNPTRGYTRKDLESVYNPLGQHGSKTSTQFLDATTTQEILIFGDVSTSWSYQSTGTLAGNIEFSINGQDFFGLVAFVATVPAKYSAHNISAIRVARTGGEGKLHVNGSV